MKLTIDALACIFHQVNKSICEAVGDYSQPEWDAAEQWQKDATLMSVQFALEHPDATPKDQHDQWLDAKLAAGTFEDAIYLIDLAKKKILNSKPTLA